MCPCRRQLLTCDHGGAVQSPRQQRRTPGMHAVHGQDALLCPCTKSLGLLKTGKEEEAVDVLGSY